MNKHSKILDKARKLKALAERGNDGEMSNARRFYKSFIEKNGISEKEIDDENYKRVFKIIDSEYEILLSHIIMSVNPFCIINRPNEQNFVVLLDDEDFIEVENKFNTFHGLFKKDEKRILYLYKDMSREYYEKEKFIFLTGFIHFHQKYLSPDDYSVNRRRTISGRNINPDMVDKVNNSINVNDLNCIDKEADNKLNDSENKTLLDDYQIKKIMLYMEQYTPINYIRSGKTLMEKI